MIIMNLAALSVAALVLAIIVSCVTSLNVGVLAIALAWIVGVYIGGMPVNTVMAGFPTPLFLTLAGVTLLFALAQCNGTLDRLAHHAVRICRGNRGVVPIMFFVLAAALASIGPGNIATAALLAPMAMATAGAHRHPAVPDGDHGRQRRQRRLAVAVRADRHHRQRADGADRHAGLRVADLPLQPARARAGRVRRLFPLRRLEAVRADVTAPDVGDRRRCRSAGDGAFEPQHWLTLASSPLLILSVDRLRTSTSAWRRSPARWSWCCRSAATTARRSSEMPWRVIVMVCGVTVLIAVLEKAQGIDLIVSLMAQLRHAAAR